MKSIVRISLLILLCLSIIPTYAQKRGSKSKVKAASSSPRSFCQGDAIPSGFVVVGSTRTSKCVELTVKKPAATETVCDGSPVPDGYSVVRQGSSENCRAASANPLTNAMVISNGENTATASSSPGARRSNGEVQERSNPSVLITVNSNVQNESDEPSPEKRREEALRLTRLSNAINNHDVVAGMNKDMLLQSLGRPYETRASATAKGTVEIWYYYGRNVQLKVYLINGVVDSYEYEN